MKSASDDKNLFFLTILQFKQKLHNIRRNALVRFFYIYSAQVFNFTKFRHSGLLFRREFIKESKTDCVFDIGANIGQFRTDVRSVFRDAEIVSFEPVKASYDVLKKLEKKDVNFRAIHLAIGKPGKYDIHIASNGSLSSSIYASEKHSDLYANVKFDRKESINVVSLEQAVNEFAAHRKRLLLKIDVQGAELDILKGLKIVDKSVKAIIVESSYTSLYSSGSTFYKTIKILNESNYQIVYIENLGHDRNSKKFHYCDIYAVSKDI